MNILQVPRTVILNSSADISQWERDIKLRDVHEEASNTNLCEYGLVGNNIGLHKFVRSGYECIMRRCGIPIGLADRVRNDTLLNLYRDCRCIRRIKLRCYGDEEIVYGVTSPSYSHLQDSKIASTIEEHGNNPTCSLRLEKSVITYDYNDAIELGDNFEVKISVWVSNDHIGREAIKAEVIMSITEDSIVLSRIAVKEMIRIIHVGELEGKFKRQYHKHYKAMELMCKNLHNSIENINETDDVVEATANILTDILKQVDEEEGKIFGSLSNRRMGDLLLNIVKRMAKTSDQSIIECYENSIKSILKI